MTDALLTRVACVQMEPVLGNVFANVDRTTALIGRSADLGATVVVLPELVTSGYNFATRDEAVAMAEPVPDGSTIRRWAAMARERHIHIVAGIIERDGSLLYDTAVLVGPEGFVGLYRKNHLWDREGEIFAPGNLGFPVFTTPVGRIGLCICYDGWFPETFRLLALGGADLVCMPANWVRPGGEYLPASGSPYSMIHMVLCAAAHCNSIPIAAADRFGQEAGLQFEGRSLIVSHTGWPTAGPASADREEIVIGALYLAKAKAARAWTATNNVLEDRRPEVYKGLVQACTPDGVVSS